jgi:type IV pilus assembly protein PilO
MGDLVERIAKLPDYQKLVIALIVYALIFVAFHMLINKKLKQDIQFASNQNAQLVDERDRTRSIAENKDQFQRDVEKLNEELSRALKELPNQREIPGLLRNVSHLGRKNGLEFQLFQPLPEVRRDFYAEVPVRIEVTGTYHEVALFFDRVGKLPRIVNIRNIEMEDPEERSGRIILNTSGDAVTYRFIEQSEGASEQSAPAAEPRRRR